MTALPALGGLLPELDAFVEELRLEFDAGGFPTSAEFIARCQRFYTAGRMAAIAEVVPGWPKMASFGDGVTLWHTTASLMSMRNLPEYRAAPEGRRLAMDWTVLLHDVEKEPTPTAKDMRHAFRSAAAAGATLPALGFPVTEEWEAGFPAWFELTDTAYHLDAERGAYVQDNEHLPAILSGADRLFRPAAAAIVKAIALHTSITVVADWPAYSALTPEEERRYVDADLHPVLLVMMLADHGGWNLFEPETLDAYYAETRAVFAQLSRPRPPPSPSLRSRTPPA